MWELVLSLACLQHGQVSSFSFHLLLQKAGLEIPLRDPRRQLRHPLVFNRTLAFQASDLPTDLFLVQHWQKPESGVENNETNATIVTIMPPPTGEHWRLFKHFFCKLSNAADTLYNRHFCILLMIVLIIFCCLPTSFYNFSLSHSLCIIKHHLEEVWKAFQRWN